MCIVKEKSKTPTEHIRCHLKRVYKRISFIGGSGMFWRDLGFTKFIRYVHSDRSHLLRYWDFMVAHTWGTGLDGRLQHPFLSGYSSCIQMRNMNAKPRTSYSHCLWRHPPSHTLVPQLQVFVLPDRIGVEGANTVPVVFSSWNSFQLRI
jgi:hypothetical protein